MIAKEAETQRVMAAAARSQRAALDRLRKEANDAVELAMLAQRERDIARFRIQRRLGVQAVVRLQARQRMKKKRREYFLTILKRREKSATSAKARKRFQAGLAKVRCLIRFTRRDSDTKRIPPPDVDLNALNEQLLETSDSSSRVRRAARRDSFRGDDASRPRRRGSSPWRAAGYLERRRPQVRDVRRRHGRRADGGRDVAPGVDSTKFRRPAAVVAPVPRHGPEPGHHSRRGLPAAVAESQVLAGARSRTSPGGDSRLSGQTARGLLRSKLGRYRIVE